jgi:endonuclease YncB( thermonuclease family)
LALSASICGAEPLKPADVYVVDGDTIVVLGKRIRLVGFDAPELGSHAHCGLERMLYGRACGVLTVDGEDVGDTLMSENLAHALVCGRYSCPKRKPWCPFEAPQ